MCPVISTRSVAAIFLKQVPVAGATTLAGAAPAMSAESDRAPLFSISLAQWSLNKHFTAKGGDLDHLDFAKVSREEFDIDHIEYSSQMFQDKASDGRYLAEMRKRQEDHGVTSLLIMVDHEGDLGSPDTSLRKKAIENHYKWGRRGEVSWMSFGESQRGESRDLGRTTCIGSRWTTSTHRIWRRNRTQYNRRESWRPFVQWKMACGGPCVRWITRALARCPISVTL